MLNIIQLKGITYEKAICDYSNNLLGSSALFDFHASVIIQNVSGFINIKTLTIISIIAAIIIKFPLPSCLVGGEGLPDSIRAS